MFAKPSEPSHVRVVTSADIEMSLCQSLELGRSTAGQSM